jgi:hypothetical protein
LTAALELIGSLGDVIDDAISRDVVERLVRWNIFPRLANHDAQFHLPVGFFGAHRNFHIVVGPDDGAGRLQKQDRLRRDGHVGFSGVVAVIEADTDDLADAGHTGTNPRRAVHPRQTRGVDAAEPAKPLGQQRRATDVRGVIG